MTTNHAALKLKKLLEKARSAEAIGNAEEAAAFSAKVQELLRKYELTMDEVEYVAVQERDPIDQDWFKPSNHGIDEKRKRVYWQEKLALMLGEAFFCKVLVVTGTNRLVFVGRKSHREVLAYVYTRLVRDCLRLQEEGYRQARAEYRRGGHRAHIGFKASFRKGFLLGIAQRLREEREAREAALEREANGKALIRLENARSQVERWVEAKVKTEKGMATRGRRGHNPSAHEAGFEAGRQANLNGDGLARGPERGRYLQAGR